MARQQTFILGSGAGASGYPATFQWSSWWKPNTVTVINLTDQVVYLNEGNIRIPSASAYTTPFPANKSLTLPTDSLEFAGFLPTPTDLDATVKVIFSYVPGFG